MKGCLTASRMFLSARVCAVSLALQAILAWGGGGERGGSPGGLGGPGQPYLLQDLHGEDLPRVGALHFAHLEHLEGQAGREGWGCHGGALNPPRVPQPCRVPTLP